MQSHMSMKPIQPRLHSIQLTLVLCLLLSPFAALFLSPGSAYAQSSLTPLVTPTYNVTINAARTGISGICVIGCGVSNRSNVTDSTTTNNATINLAVGL